MARSCGTYPILSFSLMVLVVIGWPPTITSPPSGARRPAIIDIAVVLPAPLGPSRP
jgi:hypothetical protein